MTAAVRLRSVKPSPDKPEPPDMTYEHRDRQRIAARDWAALHVAADRRSPLDFFDRLKRTWRR